MSYQKKILTACVLVFCVGFLLYLSNVNNPLFWDDDDWIVKNVVVHEINWNYIKFWFTNNTLAGIGLSSNYYRPFLFFTFALNYIFSGTNPISYHIVSNLIHLVNAILIFYLLKKGTDNLRGEGEKTFPLAAFLTALIFAVHPLQTEAVSYISGRGDPLSVMFMLLALLFFIRAEQKNSGWFSWQKITSLISLALGLLSRETAIIFPVLVVIWSISFLGKGGFIKSLKASLLKAWPYFGLVMIYGILRLTVLNFENTLNFYAQANIYSEHLYVRVFTFLRVLLTYLKLLIIPTGLHMERTMTVYTSLFQGPVFLGFSLVLTLVFWLFFSYRKAKKSGFENRALSNRFKVWFLGAGIFFTALGPVSGITPINALIYEHWLYLPLVGFFFVLAYYSQIFFEFLKRGGKIIIIILFSFLLIAYLVFFGIQTVKRNIIWGKPLEFFEEIVKYEKGSARVLNNIGNIYFNRGNEGKAEEYYWKAVEIGDIFPQPHHNLGSILQARGDNFGAIQQYEKAIEIDPNFYYPYPNLVSIYANQGNYVKAVEYIEKLKIIRSSDPRVYYNAALIYSAMGDKKKALENLNLGLNHSSYDPEAEKYIKEALSKLNPQSVR